MSKKAKPQTTLFFALSSSLVTVSLLFFLFPVKKVNCVYQGQNQEELAAVCQELEQSFRGKSLFFNNFSRENIWRQLLENNSYQQLYHLATLRKTLPGTLDLTLDARLPDYRLVIVRDEGEKNYLLNQSNRLKSNQPELELFTIIYQGETEIAPNNTFLDENYHQLFLKINQAVSDNHLPVKNLVWESDQLLKLDLGQSWLVILDKENDFARQLQVLAIILSDQAILEKIKNHRFLDLRFRLPVVRDQL